MKQHRGCHIICGIKFVLAQSFFLPVAMHSGRLILKPCGHPPPPPVGCTGQSVFCFSRHISAIAGRDKTPPRSQVSAHEECHLTTDSNALTKRSFQAKFLCSHKKKQQDLLFRFQNRKSAEFFTCCFTFGRFVPISGNIGSALEVRFFSAKCLVVLPFHSFSERYLWPPFRNWELHCLNTPEPDMCCVGMLSLTK